MDSQNKISFNAVMTAAAVLLCVIAGVLFHVLGFGTLNIVCSEIILIPSLILLMGVSIGSERVSMLIKTATSLIVIVALIANVLMGVFNAGPAPYFIIDGVLLVILLVCSYQFTKLNQ